MKTCHVQKEFISEKRLAVESVARLQMTIYGEEI